MGRFFLSFIEKVVRGNFVVNFHNKVIFYVHG